MILVSDLVERKERKEKKKRREGKREREVSEQLIISFPSSPHNTTEKDSVEEDNGQLLPLLTCLENRFLGSPYVGCNFLALYTHTHCSFSTLKL